MDKKFDVKGIGKYEETFNLLKTRYPGLEGLKKIILMSSEVPIPCLATVEVKETKNNGRGVFATEDIPKGTIITNYPCDALTEKYSENLARTSFLSGKTIDKKILEECKYDISLSDDLSIVGDPKNCSNPNFFGHLINDPCTDVKLFETDPVKALFTYMFDARKYSNVMPRRISNVQLVIVSIKDIKKDDELLMPYTHSYWVAGKNKKWFWGKADKMSAERQRIISRITDEMIDKCDEVETS